MSRRPLELAVYPKSRGMFGAQYDLPDGRHMLAREGADVMSRIKRLTDAELAAEVHAAAHEYDMDWVQTGRDESPLAEIFSAVGRFARRPHYDE